MSHLSLPRVHFRGDFVANVGTANNDGAFVDAATVRVDTDGKSDQDFRRWLQGLLPGQRGGMPAGWNYFGDHRCGFQNVKVKAAELPGRVLSTEQDDPLIGADVLLGEAAMVDLDPQGQLGTQIFCDQFGLQKDEGLLWTGPTTRLYSRWLTTGRILRIAPESPPFKGASAVWQAVWHAPLSGDQLSLSGLNSPALEALLGAAKAGGGLVVRFCTYLLDPRQDQASLARRFADGDEAENPAEGRVIGTIGPRQDGELSSVTLGRLLHPFERATGDHTQFRLGPAVAQIDRARRVVALDLITGFPEFDGTGAKENVGPVSLQLQHRAGNRNQFIRVGPVRYDQAAYEATAGIVDIPYAGDVEPHLDEGRLLLIQDRTRKALLAETDVTIETDDRALYLQEGETQQVHLRVVERGRAPRRPITVRLQISPFGLTGSDTGVVELPDRVPVEPDGTAVVAVEARRPGLCVIRFMVDGGGALAFNPATDFFANVRVLPADNYDAEPDAAITFEFVYREVLRYYHLIHPAMSHIFDLSDRRAVRRRAATIPRFISKDRWERFSYMPRTRDLSDGKRRLLQRWCRLQQEP